MAELKKLDAAPASGAAPETPKYRLRGLGNTKEFYVPATSRSYVVKDITQDQLEQLYGLEHPNVEKAG